jgi:heat-inducible transcriptional repressor
MLDHRAQHLLKTLVERYVAEGQPVGSRVLSKQSGLELSPATIRNVMADLEELGYIASPHTSSGRIPTPKGYRFFVDSLMVVSRSSRSTCTASRASSPATTGRSSTRRIALSQLTHFAGS